MLLDCCCSGNYRCFLTVLTINVTVWLKIVSVLQINLGVLSPNITLMPQHCFWICYCYTVLAPCHYRQHTHTVMFAEVAACYLQLFSNKHYCHTILLYSVMRLDFYICRFVGWNLKSTCNFLWVYICTDFNANSLSLSLLFRNTNCEANVIVFFYNRISILYFFLFFPVALGPNISFTCLLCNDLKMFVYFPPLFLAHTLS